MKYSFVIMIAMLGFATGFGLRSQSGRVGGSGQEVDERYSSRRGEGPVGGALNTPTLGWGIRGDLSLEEIMRLPVGARRNAEMALWMESATVGELTGRWDELVKSGTWEEKVNLMTLWAARDAEGALARVKGTEDEAIFFGAFALLDSERAIEWAGERNEYLLEAGLTSLARVDPYRVMGVLKESGGFVHFAVRDGIATGLMKEDPRAALDFIRGEKVHGMLGSYLREWAMVDAVSALDWGLQDNWGEMNECVSFFWEKIPEEFAKRVEELPSGRQKVELLRSQAGWLAKNDPGAAVELAREQGKEGREEMLKAIAEEIGGKGHAVMPEILGEVMAGMDASDDPFEQTMDSPWVKAELGLDPERFLEMAEVFNPALLPQALEIWASADEEAAERWKIKKGEGEK